MAITAANQANLKKKWQYFVVHFVAFPAITWTQTNITPGAITWKPFCLLSPRFSFTTGAAVTIDGTDSYTRGGAAAATVVFSKVSGPGTVTDNADKTCTVTNPGAEGLTVVQAVATAGGQTHTAFAYVHYDTTVGNLAAIASRIDGFSGSLETGEWKADIVLRGDYSAVLTNDGRDQPILMHVGHYWDGALDTFGGYKRDENTFVLLCREASLHKKHSGEYETILRLETPAYVLKQTKLYNGETKFSTTAGADIYSTANLTPTDAAYYLLREVTNLGDYFNVSLWNNASQVSNFNIRANANLWEACQAAHDYNFGMLYFNRWSNLSGKPDPRARYTEWAALSSGQVYDTPLTTDFFLEYMVHRKRTDRVGRLGLQAILPDMTIYDTSIGSASGLGEVMEISGLVAPSQAVLGQWAGDYITWLNTEYEIEFRMAMGHELNPGQIFITSLITPPLGDTIGDPITGETTWFVDDINYEFDFVRGFWTRKLYATKITVGE